MRVQARDERCKNVIVFITTLLLSLCSSAQAKSWRDVIQMGYAFTTPPTVSSGVNNQTTSASTAFVSSVAEVASSVSGGVDVAFSDDEEEEEEGLVLEEEAVSVTLTSSIPSQVKSGDEEDQDKMKQTRPMKVLFLSADTGGGHRASAESLAKQFERLYPGTTYDLLDIWTTDGCLPYRTLVPAYKHLSKHPLQWKLLYHISNSKPYEIVCDIHSTLTCERKVRKRIQSYDPDVVVSVHPTMNNVPIIALKKLQKETGKHIPFFTVVTDFGSGHCTWFHKGVEKVFVASERIRKLAKRRGSVPDSKLVQTGLPIRRAFAELVDEMGDRTSPEGKLFQRKMRESLDINPDVKTVLVMGGGEGVGGLSRIVDALYVELTSQGVDCNVLVVCGRNEKLKNEFLERDWDSVIEKANRLKKRRFFAPLRFVMPVKRVRASLLRATRKTKVTKVGDETLRKGKIQIVPLGFVTNMADYMVASDVLISKAGPGTIAEAAAVGLPVMLTSFLPGQEAGNVDVVLDGGFGDYCENPPDIAEEIAFWLKDESMLNNMSQSAYKVGAPHASEEIVSAIGESTLRWIEYNEAREE